jgi:N-acetylmuramoyl-L-alanine amidase
MASDYSLVVNGKLIYTDIPPVVEGPKVLVPLRAVAEAAGASVQYVELNREMIINKPGLEVRLWIDNYSCLKNGSRIVLTSPPKLINERTFITREEVNQIMGVEIYLNVIDNSIVVES